MSLIVLHLSVMKEQTAVFFDSTKIAVWIFTRRLPRDLLETQDVLTFLEKYLVALILYLEFLINDLCSEVGTATAT